MLFSDLRAEPKHEISSQVLDARISFGHANTPEFLMYKAWWTRYCTSTRNRPSQIFDTGCFHKTRKWKDWALQALTSHLPLFSIFSLSEFFPIKYRLLLNQFSHPLISTQAGYMPAFTSPFHHNFSNAVEKIKWGGDSESLEVDSLIMKQKFKNKKFDIYKLWNLNEPTSNYPWWAENQNYLHPHKIRQVPGRNFGVS